MKSEARYSIIWIIGFVIIILSFISCDKGNLPPVAELIAFPSTGDTTILFEFYAGESEDDRSFNIALQYRWDFEGDGIWDTEYSRESAIAHQFKWPGNYTVAVEVKDIDGFSAIARDSVVVFGMNQAIDTLHDSRDGNHYRIVKIGDQWWMAENLRYGVVLPTDREQTDNDTVEMYRILQSKRWDTVGGIYLWLETKNYRVTDPKGICPDGWHLPTREEWEDLFAPYPPLLYPLRYYGKGGLSNLNLDLNNGGIRMDGLFQERSGFELWDSGFWSSSYTVEDHEYLPYFCSFSSEDRNLAHAYWLGSGLSRYYSVRCVKDN
jgi:uncharacterized protein (TIGR02145 family)